MDQLGFIPMGNLVLGWFCERASLAFLEVRANDGSDLGDRCTLMSIEIARLNVEISVVVEAVSTDWLSEGHGKCFECSLQTINLMARSRLVSKCAAMGLMLRPMSSCLDLLVSTQWSG